MFSFITMSMFVLFSVLAISSLFGGVEGQTQINVCWLSYSFSAIYGGANALFWSSQILATLTLNTSNANLGNTAGYLVTAASGTRSVASLAGNNQVGSVTSISLTNLNSCAQGCDNVFYPGGNSPGIGGYFDGLGISFTLATPQVDNFGCDTSTFRIMSNMGVGTALGNVFSNCDNEINTPGVVATYAIGAAVPAACQYNTIARTISYTCGIGPYNFLPMSTLPDIVGTYGGYTLYVRMCGAVSQGNCVAQFGSNVMACQMGELTPSLGNIGVYPQAFTYSTSAANSMSFSYINGVNGNAGISFHSSDGEICNGIPRVFQGNLTCGAQTAITNYYQVNGCYYNYAITTPFACPPQQNLAFCQISSTTPVPAYNTWMTSISGILNANMAPPAQMANYGQNGVTYIAQNFISSPAPTISFSQAYYTPVVPASSGYGLIQSPSGIGFLPSASLSLTGAVSNSYPISIAAVGSYEGNDNVLYYIANSTSGWVTNNGLSFQYNNTNSQVYFSTGTTYVNIYYDQTIGPGTSFYSQLQVVPLGSSATLPLGWCATPTLASSQTSGTAMTFGYCLITYATGIYGEYTSSAYFASIAYGIITATSTSNNGQYLVQTVGGTRTISSTVGVAVNGASTVGVSLGGSSSINQYVYYNSPLLNATTDGITGLTFALSSNQSDASGCSGGTVQILGQAVICGLTSPNGGTDYPSYLTTFTILPGGQIPSCTPVTLPVQTYACGIGNYNFGGLSSGPDLSFTQNGYTVFLHVCGSVTQPSCVATYGNNIMACQYTSPTNLYELAAYQSPYGSAEFSYVNGVDGTAGILMVMADGLMCNDDTLYPRQLWITFLCDAASSGTKLVYYAEWSLNGGPICHYNLTVLTPYACANNNVAPVVSTSTTCAIGNYNFTQLATLNSDLVSSFAGYGIYMRLCGQVAFSPCAGKASMVCQYVSYASGVYIMAYTNGGNNLQLTYANGVNGNQGIAYSISNGADCGSNPRNVTGIISCGAVSEMTSYLESPQCNYHININTPLACNGGVGSSTIPPGTPNTVQFGFCLTVSSSNLVPGISVMQSQMQGVLTAVQQAPGSSIYVVTAATGTRNVISLNGTITNTVNINGVANGLGSSQLIYYVPLANLIYMDGLGVSVQLSASQNDGTGCIGSSITLYYGQFGCGNGFLSLSGYSLTIVPLVNGAVAPLCQIPQISLEVPPFCGVGQYSLASLANGPDLNFTGGGYTIYMRLCGAVSQPNCVASYGQNIQICQWASSSSQYEIAALYTTSGAATFSYVNGVSITNGIAYSISDGGYCGSVPRSVTGTITCGSTNAITNYYQLSGVTCQYSINITSPLVCTGSSSPTTSSSSSNSMSSGAIAGAVVGSVVGFILLCALFYCLLFTTFCRGNKGKGSSSSYGNMEPSHNTSTADGNQGEVEMGHTDS